MRQPTALPERSLSASTTDTGSPIVDALSAELADDGTIRIVGHLDGRPDFPTPVAVLDDVAAAMLATTITMLLARRRPAEGHLAWMANGLTELAGLVRAMTPAQRAEFTRQAAG